MLPKFYRQELLAVAAGVTLSFAFAPYNYFLCGLVAPAILFYLWQEATPNQAFKLGWLFGLGLCLVGLRWIYNGMLSGCLLNQHHNRLLAAMLFFAVVNFIALGPSVAGFCWQYFFRAPGFFKQFFALPAIWVVMERCNEFSSTAWLLLGYSQMNSVLRGYAPILGVYGVALIVVLNSICLVKIYQAWFTRNWQAILACSIFISVTWLMGALLTNKTWTHPFGSPIKISLIQGNFAVDTHLKKFISTMFAYKKLTENNFGSDVIIWPEASFLAADLSQSYEPYLKELQAQALRYHSTLLIGLLKAEEINGAYHVYTGMKVLGNGSGWYTKRQLLPLGEYIPGYQNIFGKSILKIAGIHNDEYVPADQPNSLLRVGNYQFAVYLCSEVMHQYNSLGPNALSHVLVISSKDTWFGHSIFQAQQLAIAQMRAMEIQRPTVTVGNSGIAAVIDYQGQVKQQLPQFTQGVLTASVQPRIGLTPWQSWGNNFLYILILLLLIVAAIAQMRAPK
jgi:apolipoprotein N-acyltransferase